MSLNLKATTLFLGTAVALAPLVSTRAQPAVPMTSSEPVKTEAGTIRLDATQGNLGELFAAEDGREHRRNHDGQGYP